MANEWGKDGKGKEPKTKAGKIIKETETGGPWCAKPIPGGRCGKKRGHWGGCK